ncbi:MAG: pyridoxamine 5'-phosphate oxidase family protein [Acetobacter sp.]|nr:pyridoxamine 5'-phosphate oxidase family protein [Bacteroides sp.]MCM1341613.1 pyridoxamine 5'-phosphate oxidase family protein [Acetobacter sp.]MCM1434066.1 pyridoxamine 5'-phosphate oxidase family protein [Clostridiales bacterium]
MFRKMRRFKQELSLEETNKILIKGTSGVLALHGDNNYPYAVPLSYVYDNEYIYFHCALDGHKLDAIKNNDKCSFCVIYEDNVLPEKFTTLFKSVICFGKIKILDKKEDKINVLNLLSEKYSPAVSLDARKEEIEKFLEKTCILALNIEHITGKQCIELVPKE